MKRIFSKLVLLCVLFCLIAGCSSNDASSGSETDYPKKPITIIVAFAAGGGSDTGARMLASNLEEKLGTPVVIENKPGASGAVGWQDLTSRDSDGYTLGYVNVPAINTSYLNPEGNVTYDLDSFTHISSHVKDIGVLSVRNDDERFDSIEDLIEYAKENTVTISSNGVGTENHIVALEMNEELGTKFESVHFPGTGEASASVLGGHVDVLVSKVGEVFSSQDELNTLAVFDSERVPQLPDVPTFKETIGSDIEFYSLRIISGPKDMDPEVVTIIQDALDEAYADQDHIQQMEEMGLIVDGTKGEELVEILHEEEKRIENMKSLLGW